MESWKSAYLPWKTVTLLRCRLWAEDNWSRFLHWHDKSWTSSRIKNFSSLLEADEPDYSFQQDEQRSTRYTFKLLIIIFSGFNVNIFWQIEHVSNGMRDVLIILYKIYVQSSHFSSKPKIPKRSLPFKSSVLKLCAHNNTDITHCIKWTVGCTETQRITTPCSLFVHSLQHFHGINVHRIWCSRLRMSIFSPMYLQNIFW